MKVDIELSAEDALAAWREWAADHSPIGGTGAWVPDNLLRDSLLEGWLAKPHPPPASPVSCCLPAAPELADWLACRGLEESVYALVREHVRGQRALLSFALHYLAALGRFFLLLEPGRAVERRLARAELDDLAREHLPAAVHRQLVAFVALGGELASSPIAGPVPGFSLAERRRCRRHVLSAHFVTEAGRYAPLSQAGVTAVVLARYRPLVEATIRAMLQAGELAATGDGRHAVTPQAPRHPEAVGR